MTHPANPPELKTAEQWAVEADKQLDALYDVSLSPEHPNGFLSNQELLQFYTQIFSQAMQQAYATGREAGLEEAASACTGKAVSPRGCRQ